MRDLGRMAFDEMKGEDKRTVTVEVMIQALENKKLQFLNGMEEYDKAVKEAEDTAESEKAKRKKARQKKQDEDEDDEDEKKKKKAKGTKSKGKC